MRSRATTRLGWESRTLVDSVASAVGVAQLVELLVVVQAVAGSSPVAHPSAKGPGRVLRKSRGEASGGRRGRWRRPIC